MAEIKNSFLSAKMNKDLDDRLIPNGEYRDALNIDAGKSEKSDVGAIEPMLGNEIAFADVTTIGLTCIGSLADNRTNCIYGFFTNYIDINASQNNTPITAMQRVTTRVVASNTFTSITVDGFCLNVGSVITLGTVINDSTIPANTTVLTKQYNSINSTWIYTLSNIVTLDAVQEVKTTPKMKIVVYNANTGIATTLVEGLFLNFAANKEAGIYGVHILETLLFWTDNRNQPRRLNIDKAFSSINYYTTEDQISVAKYAPFEPLSMVKEVKMPLTVTATAGTNILTFASTVGIEVGMTVVTDANNTSANAVKLMQYHYSYVVAVNSTTVTLYANLPFTLDAGVKLKFLASTMTDQSNDPAWLGDPVFLAKKFVRLSYRFRFEDNELSLMAPFTQPIFVPKQKGFFLNGDENAAYRSTIVQFMENSINNIVLKVPMPDICDRILNSYKIAGLDILYKESDSNNVEVLTSIESADIISSSSTSNIYSYTYKSQKPYKVLPADQTVRVYDIVPVQALSQEVSSNRIIYGNYKDKYSPPAALNYAVSNSYKSKDSNSFIEYPNHTLKQNRSYQVGFVLSDKFGRSSAVLLSNTKELSSIYTPFINAFPTDYSVRNWVGSALQLTINDQIASTKDIPNGTPGLYATVKNGTGFSITNTTVAINTTTYSFILNSGIPPVKGDYLRGKYKDYVSVTNAVLGGGIWAITTDGQVGDIYANDLSLGTTPDIKFAYTINPIGWYSYKIVVKQQEQDYYNVYLPGVLNGYPANQTFATTGVNQYTIFPVNETNKVAHTVLINDNINKVPRDLSEVGPDQRQYRSSVNLFGRVENVMESSIPITCNAAGVTVTDSTIIYPIGGVTTIAQALSIAPGTAITCSASVRLADGTIVLSNIINASGTSGTITYTPTSTTAPNGSDVITFYPVDNKSYFTTKVNDIVSAIAYANDFSFLAASSTNPNGLAALNLYQFQNSPLIARIATNSKTGVLSNQYMTPYLSVYETAPVVSRLELFWETSTSGLISDLNADIASGYEGPAYLRPEFAFYEDQNPSSTGIDYGTPGSPYITNTFYALNNSNGNISGTTAILTVLDGNGTNRSSEFALVSNYLGASGAYRVKIVSSFAFLNDASILSSFTFNMAITYAGSVTNLSFLGKLANRAPIFAYSPTYTVTGGYNPSVPVFSSDRTFNGSDSSPATFGTITISSGNWKFQSQAYITTGSGSCTTNAVVDSLSMNVTQTDGGSTVSSAFRTLGPGVYNYYLNVVLPMSPITGGGSIIYTLVP